VGIHALTGVVAVSKAYAEASQRRDGSLGEAHHEVVCSSSGRRYRGRVRVDGGRNGRDAGSQLGGLRPQHVIQSGDQCVQTATGAAGVVHTSAAICAIICAAGYSAASSNAVVGTAGPGVE
jgi:hypothetical protein